MSSTTFFISKASLRNLKQQAQSKVTGVSSAHLSEGLAAALGFKTNAALLAGFKNSPTQEVRKPNNAHLAQRLRELGYNAPSDLKLLPEFDQSYSPFRGYPLRKHRGVRWQCWRNLMVTAINSGLQQRLFGLSPGENWWPNASPEYHECPSYIFRFILDGEPAVAKVDAISGDELSISVVFKPRKEGVKPEFYSDLTDGEATAHGWLERRFGAWIQDGGEDVKCKRAQQSRLAALAIEPLGYSDQGSFFA